MPFHRNFIYYIDKRSWKYIFLLAPRLSFCQEVKADKAKLKGGFQIVGVSPFRFYLLPFNFIVIFHL